MTAPLALLPRYDERLEGQPAWRGMVTISVTFKIRISNLLNCIAKPLHCSLYRVDQLLTQSTHTLTYMYEQNQSPYTFCTPQGHGPSAQGQSS